MFPEHFSDFKFRQKKKDISIYEAMDSSKKLYILKCSSDNRPSVKQALLDEYESLRTLSHHSLPRYYGFQENFLLPEYSQPVLALCMERCNGISLNEVADTLTLNEILFIVLSTGEVLSYLLQQGILYTDLHPSNLLIRKVKNTLQITLLDFTYCYYFLKNPNPAYNLRFSYNLSPDLKGQQMLIQELTFFFHAILELQTNPVPQSLPFSVCMVLETGNHPAETLSLQEFLLMIKKCII